ncbi:hypothetical protein GCM10027161_03630 [Microbispora hainanensis]
MTTVTPNTVYAAPADEAAVAAAAAGLQARGYHVRRVSDACPTRPRHGKRRWTCCPTALRCSPRLR